MTRAQAVVIASLLAFSSAVSQAFADNTYGDCSTFYDRCYENGMQWPHADAQQVQNSGHSPLLSPELGALPRQVIRTEAWPSF
jgi:hypothetical protein